MGCYEAKFNYVYFENTSKLQLFALRLSGADLINTFFTTSHLEATKLRLSVRVYVCFYAYSTSTKIFKNIVMDLMRSMSMSLSGYSL